MPRDSNRVGCENVISVEQKIHEIKYRKFCIDLNQDSLQSVQIEQATRFGTAFPANARVKVPEGFKVSVFYAGSPLQKPRFMTWSPDTVLHIADLSAASIFALPDKDADGIADTIRKIATNVVAHDIAFYRGDLYAA
ncbi:hypothetical protein EBV26_19365, partial [bacterium]|nr:hypothetical protein [bacterium]